MAAENEAYEMEKTEEDKEAAKEKNEIVVRDEIEVRRALYEETLAACGFGKFQIILFLVCGWALASDSAEVQVVSFVLPSACDLEMTSHQKGWLNAIVFVGMMVGGYLLGGAADVKGRRYVLLCSMSIDGTFGLLSAFAPNFVSFLCFRFMSGIGVGAAIPIVFSYCAEFMNAKKRGPMLGLLATFWMVGNILTCVSAWIVLPRVNIGIQASYMFFGNWRIFVVIGSIPSISSAIFLAMMPESPMFLTKKGRFEEAKKVFLTILRRNHGSDTPVPDELEKFTNYYCIHTDNTTTATDKPTRSSFVSGLCELATTLKKVLQSTRELFLKPHTSTTIMLIAIWYTLSFGFYGLWMWFPEIFKRVESGGGNTCTHTTVSHMIKNTTTNMSSLLTCKQQTATQTSVYLESLLVAISSVPGNLITIALVNRLGRRPLMACSMILSAVSVFFFTLVKNRAGMIAMSCIFSGMSVVGFNVLDMMSIENYPTDLRTTAFGVQSTCGRIAAITGNVAFGALVDQHCAVPLLLIAILLSAGGLVTLKLPKTDDMPLQN